MASGRRWMDDRRPVRCSVAEEVLAAHRKQRTRGVASARPEHTRTHTLVRMRCAAAHRRQYDAHVIFAGVRAQLSMRGDDHPMHAQLRTGPTDPMSPIVLEPNRNLPAGGRWVGDYRIDRLRSVRNMRALRFGIPAVPACTCGRGWHEPLSQRLQGFPQWRAANSPGRLRAQRCHLSTERAISTPTVAGGQVQARREPMVPQQPTFHDVRDTGQRPGRNLSFGVIVPLAKPT